MKVRPECFSCSLRRSLLEFRDAGDDRRYEIVKRLSHLYVELAGKELSTMDLYWRKNALLDELRGDVDRYRSLKDQSLAAAEKLAPVLQAYAEEGKTEVERLKRAFKVALAGNTMEFGANDHDVDIDALEEHVRGLLEMPRAIDDIEAAMRVCHAAKTPILYVTDNTAELVFDAVLIRELSARGPVTVCPLSSPRQDDATLEDVRRMRFPGNVTLLPRGEEIGIVLEKAPNPFHDAYERADLVIAKGMACRETVPDYAPKKRGAVCFLYKAKCRPVADAHGVPLGSLNAVLESAPLHPPG